MWKPESLDIEAGTLELFSFCTYGLRLPYIWQLGTNTVKLQHQQVTWITRVHVCGSLGGISSDDLLSLAHLGTGDILPD